MILPHLELKCAPVLLTRGRVLLLCPQFICNCQDSPSSSTDWASACKSCRVDHRLLGSLVGKLGLHHHLFNVGLGQLSPRLKIPSSQNLRAMSATQTRAFFYCSPRLDSEESHLRAAPCNRRGPARPPCKKNIGHWRKRETTEKRSASLKKYHQRWR